MKNLLLILSILIFISSCATIMTGKTQEVTFDSEPQGAEVAVNGRVIGKTPTTIQLDKKKDQTVSFKLEGYKTQTRTLETKVNTWFMGNIVLGGFIGSTTDGIRTVSTKQHDRSPWISEHIKRKAKGVCQLCIQKAPFLNKKGVPYLETHHIIWLSKGGEDSIQNTVALCPNCHRKMHILNNKSDRDILTNVAAKNN